MDADTLIAARPHFRQQGRDLFFFLSDRVFHSLNPDELKLWRTLFDHPIQLKEVGVPDVVESLARAGLIETIAPIAAGNRRRILVIEPHCDDAALSIGATMWKLRNEIEFHLLTLASRSNYTSNFHLRRDFFNREEITRMRTTEGNLFVSHIGGRYECLGMAEATLRYRDDDWDLEYFKSHEAAVAIHNNRQADDSVLDLWSHRLDEFLSKSSFEEIWIPLGAGNHADHDLARNASLRALMERSYTKRVRIIKDVPYGTQFKGHVQRILKSLEKTGAVLAPWPQDVTEAFTKKISLLGIFASQFKVSAVEPRVLESAGSEIDANRIEHLWTVDVLPRELRRDEMWIGAPQMAEDSTNLAKLLKNAARAKRVAIFAIYPSGRWDYDLNQLIKMFPAAKFIVYAGPKVFAEFQSIAHPRFELRNVDGRSKSWVKAALREFGTSHRIIVAGEAIAKARRLSYLWGLGRKAVIQQFSHIAKAVGS